jgi:hypothetical protein
MAPEDVAFQKPHVSLWKDLAPVAPVALVLGSVAFTLTPMYLRSSPQLWQPCWEGALAALVTVVLVCSAPLVRQNLATRAPAANQENFYAPPADPSETTTVPAPKFGRARLFKIWLATAAQALLLIWLITPQSFLSLFLILTIAHLRGAWFIVRLRWTHPASRLVMTFIVAWLLFCSYIAVIIIFFLTMAGIAALLRH